MQCMDFIILTLVLKKNVEMNGIAYFSFVLYVDAEPLFRKQ